MENFDSREEKLILIIKLHDDRMICPYDIDLTVTWYIQFNN